MRAIVLIVALLALYGCAIKVASSNPRQVVIEHPGGIVNNREAQLLADAECAKHKRFAKMTAWPVAAVSRTWVFSCVE